MSGEETYSLNSLKEIRVTDDFLQLGENVKNCQNKESFEDCQASQFIKKVEDECNCVPYRLKNFTNNLQVVISTKNMNELSIFVGHMFSKWK